uniref:NADH-cytochrome b5 reductase n=1 Tax=Rhabditophanes sp. KR3021 TaxID=114890 RepID=A0AC35TST3_9BILA
MSLSSNITIASAVVASSILGYVIYKLIFKKKKVLFDPTNPTDKHSLMIEKNEIIAHNVRKMKLSFTDCDVLSGLSPGQHVSIQGLMADIKPAFRVRFYSPVHKLDLTGFIEIIYKEYPEELLNKKQGAFSRYLASKKVGEQIAVSGPYGFITYYGKGTFFIKAQQRKVNFKHLVMLACGSGITPMFQLIQSILEDQSDQTKITLLYSNKQVDDIILREQLDTYEKQNEQRLKVIHTLTRLTEQNNWEGETGRIDKDKIVKHMPPPSSEVFCLICGTKDMNVTLKEIASKLGYGNIYCY